MGLFPSPSSVTCLPTVTMPESPPHMTIPVSSVSSFPALLHGVPLSTGSSLPTLLLRRSREMGQAALLGAPKAQWPSGGACKHTEALSYWFHVDLQVLPGAYPVMGGAVPIGYPVEPSV